MSVCVRQWSCICTAQGELAASHRKGFTITLLSSKQRRKRRGMLLLRFTAQNSNREEQCAFVYWSEDDALAPAQTAATGMRVPLPSQELACLRCSMVF